MLLDFLGTSVPNKQSGSAHSSSPSALLSEHCHEKYPIRPICNGLTFHWMQQDLGKHSKVQVCPMKTQDSEFYFLLR